MFEEKQTPNIIANMSGGQNPENAAKISNQVKKKINELRDELDKTKELLEKANQVAEDEKKAREQSEAEVSALQRRCQLVEEDLERSEERLGIASEKLEEASKAADESERWESDSEPERDKEYPQLNIDESTDESTKTDRLTPPDSLSPDPSTTTTTITTTRRHSVVLDTIKEESFTEKGLLLYPLMLEASRRLAMLEVDLERAEQRADDAEAKIQELEEELKVVGNNMKSLEVSEAEALSREESYEETIRDLSTRFKDAEARAAEGERQTGKLQKECDKLEADLVQEQEKYKAICDELERAFNELSGY